MILQFILFLAQKIGRSAIGGSLLLQTRTLTWYGCIVICQVIHSGKPTEPKAFNTVFGWAIVSTYQGTFVQTPTLLHAICEPGEDLKLLLKCYWEVVDLIPKTEQILTTSEHVQLPP